MTTRGKVLLLGDIDQYVSPFADPFFFSYYPTSTLKLTNRASAHESWSSLGKIADLIKPAATNRTEFIQECKDGKFDGVVAAYRTFPSVDITGLIDEELVAVLPKSLTYLAHCGMSAHSSFDMNEINHYMANTLTPRSRL